VVFGYQYFQGAKTIGHGMTKKAQERPVDKAVSRGIWLKGFSEDVCPCYRGGKARLYERSRSSPKRGASQFFGRNRGARNTDKVTCLLNEHGC